MSEILIAGTAAYKSELPSFESEGRVPETVTPNQEIKDPTWGDTLYDLVSTNAYVIVTCPWMGGSEVTLSTAMTTYIYPPNMTEADIPSVIAVVNELLANRVEESEEDESDNEALSEDAKEEAKPDQDNKNQRLEVPKNTSKVEKQSKTTAKETKPTEIPTGRIEKPEFNIYKLPAKTEEVVNGAEVDTKQLESSEILKESIQPISIDEVKQSPAISQISPSDKTESLSFTETTKIIPTPKPIELPSLELETNIYAPHEEETVLPVIENPDEGDIISDFIEEELPPEDFEAYSFEAFEAFDSVDSILEEGEEVFIYHEEDELGPFELIDTKKTELALGKPTIEAIEGSLIQLAEVIEASPPEVLEDVNEILDKIIQLPIKLEQPNDENINEVEVQEQLEELFAELFQKMEIEYSPELIESLACFTLEWNLTEEFKKLKPKDEQDEMPQVTGTHEIIKKFLAVLGAIKKTITHAVAIGKSALQLYALRFAV